MSSRSHGIHRSNCSYQHRMTPPCWSTLMTLIRIGVLSNDWRRQGLGMRQSKTILSHPSKIPKQFGQSHSVLMDSYSQVGEIPVKSECGPSRESVTMIIWFSIAKRLTHLLITLQRFRSEFEMDGDRPHAIHRPCSSSLLFPLMDAYYIGA